MHSCLERLLKRLRPNDDEILSRLQYLTGRVDRVLSQSKRQLPPRRRNLIVALLVISVLLLAVSLYGSTESSRSISKVAEADQLASNNQLQTAIDDSTSMSTAAAALAAKAAGIPKLVAKLETAALGEAQTATQLTKEDAEDLPSTSTLTSAYELQDLSTVGDTIASILIGALMSWLIFEIVDVLRSGAKSDE